METQGLERNRFRVRVRVWRGEEGMVAEWDGDFGDEHLFSSSVSAKCLMKCEFGFLFGENSQLVPELFFRCLIWSF